MTTALTILLVLVCVGVTFALLGALRGIADIRIQLAGGGTDAESLANDKLMPGKPIPSMLRSQLPWGDEDALVVFVSSHCETCSTFLDLVPHLAIPNLAIGVASEASRNGDGLEIVGTAFVLTRDVVDGAVEALEISGVPLALHVRQGVIVGAAHGQGLTDLTEIHQFWTAGGAPLMEVTI